MKRKSIGILAVLLLAGTVFLGPVSFAQNKEGLPPLKQAHQLWAEKSYHEAIAIYETLLSQKDLSPSTTREIQFKLADAGWRSQESSRFDKSVKLLKELIESKDHDRWWAESSESLAECFLQKDQWNHQQEIKDLLQNAREFWAGSAEVELARPRFIKATFTLGDFISRNWGWFYNGIVPTGLWVEKAVPKNQNANSLSILYDEILKVAATSEDKAKAHYALGMSYFYDYNDQEKRGQAVKHFEEVIAKFPTSEWVDDAYYNLGQYYEQRNEFAEALKAYQGLLAKFSAGTSQWVDEAQRKIKDITSPQMSLGVSYTFLPGSQIQFSVNHRNISEVKFSLYQVDLAQELQLDLTKAETDYSRGINQYTMLLERLVASKRYSLLPVAFSWKTTFKELDKKEKYKWFYETKNLANWRQGNDEDEKVKPELGVLKPGAYLLLAEANGVRAQELILVTDLGIVTKTGGQSALIYAFDAKTGTPRAKAKVKFQYQYYDDNGLLHWEEGQGLTDSSGLFKARLRSARNRNYARQHQLFTCVSDGVMQAFANGNYYENGQGNNQWRFYAYSDRPAYRPNEEVAFKGILRRYDEKSFHTPGPLRIQAYIYDPRGNKIKEQQYTLNNFGSFAGTLTLDDKAALGEYRIEIYSENKSVNFGQATLFRLEEYKLPEFLVNIKPQPKDGETVSTYQLGDKVTVELDGQYYFGGPVAEADVEYLVYQSPYYHYYAHRRDYPWFYEDLRSGYNNYYQGGVLLKKETIKTDKEGKAVFNFETPSDSPQDLVYRVEARVVDQSRREIRATAEIKVTKTPFYAYLTPKQNLYRPGDKAEVEIKTMTANDAPVSVEGKVAVSRHWWQDPVIREEKVVAQGHYGQNELVTKFVKTNDKGETVFSFEPSEDGYYVVEFTGFDAKGQEIKSQTNVFVCHQQSQNLGYHSGGIQIIAEKDTYYLGENIRVMLVADKPDTWVLFTTEADEIYDENLFHLEGTVKLLEFPVKEGYLPNIFLNAVSADNYQLKNYGLQLIIPPDEKFLNIKITSDKEIYKPRQQGAFEIEVRDKNGQPVSGEVSLGLVDASVYYIQGEYAKDIREFFYGTKRQQTVQLQTSFNQRPYQRLEFMKKAKIVDGQNGRALQGRLKSAADDIGEVYTSNGAGLQYEPYYAASTFRSEERLSSSARRGDVDFEKKDANKPAAAPAPTLVGGKGRKEEGGLVTPDVRSDFRSTVVWQPTIVTDETGKAKLTVTFPDSLTTWRATARSITNETFVGTVTQETKTSKEIIVRLQAPRFFTERDEVTISANVHNYTFKEQKIKVTLKSDGLELKSEPEQWITVSSQGEMRVDWKALAKQEGKAELTVLAQGKDDSDAMVKTFPVIPHGIEKFIAQALALKGQAEGQESLAKQFILDIPKERIKESTTLQINLSPSLAATLLDALPYLAGYPYGCVEQTLSRFLPSVVVKKTMLDLGLSEKDVDQYLSDVLGPRPDPKIPSQGAVTFTQLDNMTRDGLNRLYDFQHADGGWGWWKEGSSDRFMSAYVVWGLSLARQAGVPVRGDVLSRGVNFLQKQLVEEENEPDMLAWMLYALSSAQSRSSFEDKQTDRLWQMRDKLNPYTRALFALSEFYRGHQEKASVLARNMANGLIEDKENSTVHWGESGVYYRFSEGGVEATAFAVKALVNIMPDSPYIEPAVKWLSLNRRGARWKNTRDTAIVVLSLADYLKKTDELTPDFDYAVLVNGKSVQSGHIDRGNVFTFNRYLQLPNAALHDGQNKVEVSLKGKGALYAAGYLKYFTKEENITPAGNEVFVERKYFLEDTRATLMKGYKQNWQPLKSGDQIKSGDRVRVEITLEAKNHYEYLIVEDTKPAGLEAVELKSGSGTARRLDPDGTERPESLWLYQEFRDQKAVFFIDKLPEGQTRIDYELRAEVPGQFHAMPDLTHAMYVPEIRANSSEMLLTVEDKGKE